MPTTATKEKPAAKSKSEEALRAKANEIADLLPRPECTAADLRDEIGLLPGDVKKLREAGKIGVRNRGRVEFFKTYAVAREIVAHDIPWKRTRLSLDRERYSFEELIDYDTLYPTQQTIEKVGVDQYTLAAAMDLSDVRKFSSHIAGGTLIRALRVCQQRGVRVFLRADFLQPALEKLKPAPAPVAPPVNPVDDAINQHQAKLREEREQREFALLSEWGRFVRLRGELTNSQLLRVGEIAVELGYDGRQYQRDVQTLETAEHLKNLQSEEAQAKARKALDDACAKHKELQRQEMELPRLIQKASGESQVARRHLNDCLGASSRITEMANKQPHLFEDPSGWQQDADEEEQSAETE